MSAWLMAVRLNGLDNVKHGLDECDVAFRKSSETRKMSTLPASTSIRRAAWAIRSAYAWRHWWPVAAFECQ